MIKKIGFSLIPALMLTASFSAYSAAHFAFEFSASNPADQLAWASTDNRTQVASLKAAKPNGKGWDPLGVVTTTSTKNKTTAVVAKKASPDLLKTVSAKRRIDVKKAQGIDSIDNIWDLIH